VVLERVSVRGEYPDKAGKIKKKKKVIILLVCSGWKEEEIADTLNISRRTVIKHKSNIYRKLNVRNALELLQNANEIGLVNFSELNFRHRDFVISPKPARKTNNNEQ
jgi:DNA-binding NarL/FixJ family response regulator